MTQTAPTVAKLGDLTVPLRIPESIASRFDVLTAGGANLNRAACAALAMAWTGPGRPKTRKSHDVLDYGGRVMDELTGRGLKPVQVLVAGVVAFNLITNGLITEDEVDEEEGNSEAPGDSTPS